MSGYVLDDLFLRELARGDDMTANLVAALDFAAERMSVPAVTLAHAQAGLSPRQQDTLNGLVENLPNVLLDVVANLDHTLRIAAIAEHLGDAPDLSASHVVAVSRYLDFPILTLDRERWAPVLDVLPWQVTVVEASDPV
ncbi:hypothetical protein [Nonomuraea sp. NPDC050310]|uniref:hypothetical protein n=1 Tax=Nonomuraea sp. NPDC050310 TaxID=3154935 RepID=UPI0033E6DF6A